MTSINNRVVPHSSAFGAAAMTAVADDVNDFSFPFTEGAAEFAVLLGGTVAYRMGAFIRFGIQNSSPHEERGQT